MARIMRYISDIIGESAKAKAFFAASLLFVLILSFSVIYYVWIYSINETREEELRTASVAVAGFGSDNIKSLTADENDLTSEAYLEVKKSLEEIVSTHPNVRFAYIFKMKNDRIYFAADSEPADSADYSPPGQEYTEASPIDKQPFYDGKPAVVQGVDRWGSWVSVLVPVKDRESGEILAVFGMDHTIDNWYKNAIHATILAAVTAVCIVLLYFSALVIICINISLRREKAKLSETNVKLQENERSYSVLLSNLPGMAYRCKYDREWTTLFVSEGCFDLTGYSSSRLLNNEAFSFNDLISPKYREYLREKWADVVDSRTRLAEEYEIITASGEKRWVFEQGQAIYDEYGNVEALEGMIIDITDRKKKEEEILHLNYHDFLTGIYNRRFLELMKERMDRADFLPLSVMIGDINGLKLVNDALGHAQGDILIAETAKIIQGCCRENDIAARTGGDEFIILMPFTDKETANGILEKIKRKCMEYNQNLSSEAYAINISLGFATKESESEHLDETIKLAESSMYKSKLLEHKSSHSVIISSIKATIHEKSHETQEHAERLTHLSKELGRKMKLTQQELDGLELVATLHDIGKVGVDDRILNKPGKLNEIEWIEMKKHSEIGYRIAMSSHDLVGVAEDILCLHERWDGTGYPQGIKGKEIPLLSRIVSVVDAYDAMTEDRAYRKAMSEKEAAEELRKNAGTQFDPKIVKIFLEKVLTKNERKSRSAKAE